MSPTAATPEELREQAQRAIQAEQALAQARADRDRLALEAYEAGDLTYDDIGRILGVSRDRVNQVLATQRRLRAARTS